MITICPSDLVEILKRNGVDYDTTSKIIYQLVFTDSGAMSLQEVYGD